eukprot:scaffold918_cov126-Cylindrotheca_fusiformis.AAC.82
MSMVPSALQTFAKAAICCLFLLSYLKKQTRQVFDYNSAVFADLDRITAPQIEERRLVQERRASVAVSSSNGAGTRQSKLLPEDASIYIKNTTASTSSAMNLNKARNTWDNITVMAQPPKNVPVHSSLQYNGTNSFGACLMWMDDYSALVEWIAYHYHVLPLRHLVLFRDPKSAMDPSPILDRWRPYMNITFWTTTTDFSHIPATQSLSKLEHKPMQHYLETQRVFYGNCLNHLKKHGWTWTFVADTDEFLVLNKHAVPNAGERMKQHGSIMDTLQYARSSNSDDQNNNKTRFSFQSKRQQQRWGNASTVCVTMKREQYSSFESPKEVIKEDVPPFLDPYRFQTMRFRYHRKKTMIGKSIVDVSRVSVDADTTISAHRVLRGCGNAFGFSDDLMHVNHYLGSWEHFRRPNDSRGGPMRYKKFIELNEAVNASMRPFRSDEIRPWLQGFVDSMGKERSLSLLEGVGFPYNSSTALQIRS